MWANLLMKLNPWMIYLKIAAAILYTLAVVWATHRLDVLVQAEKDAAAAKEIARLQDENQRLADHTGAAVEDALRNFRNRTRGITHAPISRDCLLTVDRVQPLAAAIDAGNAAREYTGTVQ